LGTALGNILRTWGTTWEHVGTHQQLKKKKKTSPPFPPKPKLKSWGP
jgi:hypothetical protein